MKDGLVCYSKTYFVLELHSRFVIELQFQVFSWFIWNSVIMTYTIGRAGRRSQSSTLWLEPIRKLRHRGQNLPRFLVSSKRKINMVDLRRKELFERTLNNRQKYWESWRQSLTNKGPKVNCSKQSHRWTPVLEPVQWKCHADDHAWHLVLLPLLTTLPLLLLERRWCCCCFASTCRLDSPHPVPWVTSSRLLSVLRMSHCWSQVRGLCPRRLLSFLWEGLTLPFYK